jgi:hypothetical protein
MSSWPVFAGLSAEGKSAMVYSERVSRPVSACSVRDDESAAEEQIWQIEPCWFACTLNDPIALVRSIWHSPRMGIGHSVPDLSVAAKDVVARGGTAATVL